mgnify:CR=1 FL=1
MTGYVVRRLIQAVLLIKCVLVVVFLLLHLTGEPAALLAGPDATAEDVARLRTRMGFDQPLWVQYGRFFLGVTQGNFGKSFEHGESALSLVLERLPATLELALGAFFLSVVIGVPMGCVAAFKENTFFDRGFIGTTVFVQAVPDFWLGIMMITFFSVHLGVLPSFGRGGWGHFVMPAFAASIYHMARLGRLMRSQMLEVMRNEYILTARAKGLPETVVVMVHALKNSAIPIVTVMGLDLGILLGGTVIVETVFAWPGVGRLVVQAIANRDFPIVQAVVFILASGFVLINLTVDLLYAYLDPRIEYQ